MTVQIPSRRLLACSALLFLAALPAQAANGPAASQFTTWLEKPQVSRTITLAQLANSQTIVLKGRSSSQEFFFPVPAGTPLQNAGLQFAGHYLRGDGGRTNLLLAIDGTPVSSRKLDSDTGDAGQQLPVSGEPRRNGFVQLRVNWASQLSEQICSNEQTPGNVLNILPDTALQYQFNPDAITTVASAWQALPPQVTLLVSGTAMSRENYDSAWRIGVQLQRGGKEVRIASLPKVGSSIDLATVRVPDTLKGIPAFASISKGSGYYTLQNEAEVGALLALGELGPVRADVLLDEPALRQGIKDALDALEAQIRSASADAAEQFSLWRSKRFALPSGQDIAVTQFAGQPAILIAASKGRQAVSLLTPPWQALARNLKLTVPVASDAMAEARGTLLDEFGPLSGTMDVIAQSERRVSFDLHRLAAAGQLPATLVVDVSAAPNSSREKPVVSVLLNDMLIGASHLQTSGTIQRIEVAIPPYLLRNSNTVTIRFTRQPSVPHCHDIPAAYPVSILPSSHIRLDKGTLGNDFLGLSTRLNNGGTLLMSEALLASPQSSLPGLIDIAFATGISPQLTASQFAAAGQRPTVSGNFLAVGVIPAGTNPAAQFKGGQLLLSNQGPLLDVATLQDVAIAEVVSSGEQAGIVYQGSNQALPAISGRPPLLSKGNLAAISAEGILLAIDRNDPTGEKLARDANPQTIWDRYWWAWSTLLGVIVFALLAARITQVRRRSKGDTQL